MTCPRCGTELASRGGQRWRCARCKGAAVYSADFVAELRRVAPDLVPTDDDPPVLTDARRSAEPALACPSCGEPMEPVLVAHVDLDRCYRDSMFWFDDFEQAAVLDVAKREQMKRIRGVLRSLFGD